MGTRTVALSGLLAVLGSLVVVGAGATSSVAGVPVVVRYASPTGTASATCPKAVPCDLDTAIDSAPADSHVILLPGTYLEGNGLADNNSDLLISGEAGAARPVIDSSVSANAALQITNGSRVTGLTINYTGSNQALYVGSGSADHMIVSSTGAATVACGVLTSLSDSVCTISGANAAAISVSILGQTVTATLRNVTAIATGAGSRGLYVDGDDAIVNVNATNSIFKGTDKDIRIFPEDDQENDTVTLHNCDFATSFYVTLMGLTTETINVDDTDIKAAPKFVNATAGNYRERLGSPTINRGAPVAGPDTDVIGNPRTLGKAADIGAYEFEQKAAVAGLKLSKKKPRSVSVAASINPEGLATTYYLVATHGPVTLHSKRSSAGKGRAAKKVMQHLTSLQPNTKYKIRVVAVNAGGTTTTAAKPYKTPRH